MRRAGGALRCAVRAARMLSARCVDARRRRWRHSSSRSRARVKPRTWATRRSRRRRTRRRMWSTATRCAPRASLPRWTAWTTWCVFARRAACCTPALCALCGSRALRVALLRLTPCFGWTSCSPFSRASCWSAKAPSSAHPQLAHAGAAAAALTRACCSACSYRRGVVARAYLTRGFLPDALSALPFDAVGGLLGGGGGGGDGRALALKLLRLPRLLRLSRLLHKARRRCAAACSTLRHASDTHPHSQRTAGACDVRDGVPRRPPRLCICAHRPLGRLPVLLPQQVAGMLRCARAALLALR